MTRTVRYALLSALLGCAAHAQIEQIAGGCKLTPDMDYLMVSTWTMDGGVQSRTYVAGPDWIASGGELALRIADHASLQEGKAWWGLPAETPAYCEVTLQAVDLPDEWDLFAENSYRDEIYVFGLPKDRWPHQRNDGVAGYLRALDRFYDPEFSRVTVSVRLNQAAHTWLVDYYTRLERELEILEERSAHMEDQVAETSEEDTPAIHIVAGEDHFLAVATAPPAGWRIEASEPGYFGFGWHIGSHHDAGTTAVDECRRQGGGSACSFNADGTSMRGGCVGLAMAKWRDRDEDSERSYVVRSSSFRDLMTRDLRSGCRSTAFGGRRRAPWSSTSARSCG